MSCLYFRTLCFSALREIHCKSFPSNFHCITRGCITCTSYSLAKQPGTPWNLRYHNNKSAVWHICFTSGALPEVIYVCNLIFTSEGAQVFIIVFIIVFHTVSISQSNSNGHCCVIVGSIFDANQQNKTRFLVNHFYYRDVITIAKLKPGRHSIDPFTSWECSRTKQKKFRFCKNAVQAFELFPSPSRTRASPFGACRGGIIRTENMVFVFVVYILLFVQLFLFFLYFSGRWYMIPVFLEFTRVSAQALICVAESASKWFLSPKRKKLEGEIALVTGGASGIGRLVALSLGKRGKLSNIASTRIMCTESVLLMPFAIFIQVPVGLYNSILHLNINNV